MNVETSTLNIMLGLIVAMQAWIVRELFKLKTKVALLAAKLKDKSDEE